MLRLQKPQLLLRQQSLVTELKLDQVHLSAVMSSSVKNASLATPQNSKTVSYQIQFNVHIITMSAIQFQVTKPTLAQEQFVPTLRAMAKTLSSMVIRNTKPVFARSVRSSVIMVIAVVTQSLTQAQSQANTLKCIHSPEHVVFIQKIALLKTQELSSQNNNKLEGSLN